MANEASGGAEPRFDILIRGGNVLDGMGSATVRADVGIIGERIAAVGDLANADVGRMVDATGLSVAPGFIDIHTHSDISSTYDSGQASAIGMGVTTQVTGNCGLSLGFVQDRDVFVFEKRWIAPHKARITWDTFDGFLRTVEDKGTATNFYPLAGHGTLRKRVMGMEERPPSTSDMTAMQRELQAAIDAGVWGLSSGLEYPPSSYADENELAELCKTVAQSGGFYATHLRNEGDTLVEAVQEALNVIERAGLPLQLSHHKAEGKTNWGKIGTTLGMVDAARNRGLDVQLDQYPYTAFMTALSIQLLPKTAQAPTETVEAEGPWKGDKNYAHAAFGLATVTRWQSGGNGHRLFGSDLGHSVGLTIKVSLAGMKRGLSYDRYYERERLLELSHERSAVVAPGFEYRQWRRCTSDAEQLQGR